LERIITGIFFHFSFSFISFKTSKQFFLESLNQEVLSSVPHFFSDNQWPLRRQ